MPLLSINGKFAGTALKLFAISGLTLGLAACGQRGPLQAPTANTNTQTSVSTRLPDGSTVIPAEPEAATPTKAPDDSFILDPLL